MSNEKREFFFIQLKLRKTFQLLYNVDVENGIWLFPIINYACY